MADAVHTSDQARGLEYQDITDNVRGVSDNVQDVADNVRALRDELHGLTDYLQRTSSPRAPVILPRTPSPRAASPPRIQLVDRPAGDSIVLSPVIPGVIEVDVPAPASSLFRSTSNASSFQSYLSSQHSDDDIFECEMETPLPSPAV